MKITIDYGRTGLQIDVPDQNLKAVLGLQPTEPLADPDEVVRRAIECPIGTLPLRTIAAGRRSACILICDITRPVPNKALLTPVLEVLSEARIATENITILVATGLHRASTPDEIQEMLGASIPASYRVESHDARDAASHVNLGTLSNGAPAYLDRRYIDADLKVTTGLIEPHLMAGFSGGRKVICPGIASTETIRHFHGVSILQSPLSTAGQLAGNPVHQMSLEAARMAGCDFIVNVALDDSRRITGVFAGEMEAAWEAGVEQVRSIARAPLATPVDVVITSAAGYPLDSSFYQSVKGLVGAMPAVKPGGTIIMAASMSEGIGSPDFEGLLSSHRTLPDLVKQLHEPGFFCIDQWQAQELANACSRADVMVYSDSLSPKRLAQAHVTPISSITEGINRALQRHGADASIAVIPRGPYVLPNPAAQT